MTLDRALLLVLLALSILAIVYLAAAESNRRLGLRLKEATGGEREAYALITRVNVENAQVDAQTDSMIARGMTLLTAAELDALLAPRVRPIEPHEFRVTERGAAMRFEDDRGRA